MNLLFLLALAVPLSCLALLASLALLGVLTLGGAIHVIAKSNSLHPPQLGDGRRPGSRRA